MARPDIGDKIKTLAGGLGVGQTPASTDVFDTAEPRATKLRLVDIEPDPDQPRVDPGDVSDLVTSIREHGLLQPLIVSPRGVSGKYRIIAGERRFTACLQAGLKVVDAIIRTDRDQSRLEIQLIENLHRKGLDPFEEARGFHRLKNEFNLTDQQVAERMGKTRTHVTQTLSINRIPEEIRRQCQSSDNPLSRDTLYLIAKQPTVERMNEVLAQARLPRGQRPTQEERRDQARKGQPRLAVADSLRKPKAVYRTDQNAIVIVQGLTPDDLTHRRKLAALKQAIQEEKHRH